MVVLLTTCAGGEERHSTSNPVGVADAPTADDGNEASPMDGNEPSPMDDVIVPLDCPAPTWATQSVGAGRVRGYAATARLTQYVLLGQPDGRLVLARQRRGQAWEHDPLPDRCRLASAAEFRGQPGRQRLALDGSGVPHVLCGSLDQASGVARPGWSLRLFTRRAGVWQDELIAATEAPSIYFENLVQQGEFAGLALAPDGAPHVVFTRRVEAEDGGSLELETLHTWRAPDGRWQETSLRFYGSVDDLAIGTDSAGEPRVAIGWTYRVGETIELHRRRGGTWSVSTLDTSGDDESTRGLALAVGVDDLTFVTRVDHRHEIDLDERGILEVIEAGSGGKRVVSVDGPGSYGDGRVDGDIAVAVRATNQPVVAYRNAGLDTLRLAWRQPPGWYQRETLQPGTEPALAVLASGAVSVAFTDASGEVRVTTQHCP